MSGVYFLSFVYGQNERPWANIAPVSAPSFTSSKKKKMATGVSCLSHIDVVYVVKITPSTPQFASWRVIRF